MVNGNDMKVIVSGGTGFIGSVLMQTLAQRGHEVLVLSRSGGENLSHRNVRVVQWDGRSAGAWTSVIEGADAIINLAGESIGGGRWTKQRKHLLMKSRYEPTRALIAAISGATSKPSVLINASAVGYYGPHKDEEITESKSSGSGFLAELAAGWEAEAAKAEEHGIRVVRLRTGVVLGKRAEALRRMVLPLKFFLGGHLGDGLQWFPWVHVHDAVAIITLATERTSITGPVNVVAPYPVRLKEFYRSLAHVMRRPSWAPVPAFVLKLVLGEMSSLLLEGQKVLPSRLLDEGFQFSFPRVEDALKDILAP
jgi:uncharacterized protein